MNILIEDKRGNWVVSQECAYTWMNPKPEDANCHFCTSKIWLRADYKHKVCTVCGTLYRLKLGDFV